MSLASVCALVAGVGVISRALDTPVEAAFGDSSVRQVAVAAGRAFRNAGAFSESLGYYTHDYSAFLVYGVGALVVLVMLHRS